MRGRCLLLVTVSVWMVSCGSNKDGNKANDQGAAEQDTATEAANQWTEVRGWMLESAWRAQRGWQNDATGMFNSPHTTLHGDQRIPIPRDTGPWVFRDLPPECAEDAPSLDRSAYLIWIKNRTASVYLQGEVRKHVQATGEVVSVRHKHPTINGGVECTRDDFNTRWIPVSFRGAPWPGRDEELPELEEDHGLDEGEG